MQCREDNLIDGDGSERTTEEQQTRRRTKDTEQNPLNRTLEVVCEVRCMCPVDVQLLTVNSVASLTPAVDYRQFLYEELNPMNMHPTDVFSSSTCNMQHATSNSNNINVIDLMGREEKWEGACIPSGVLP
jgi:hypothetical protein